MKQFEIKITGSGTIEQIIQALKDVSNSIIEADIDLASQLRFEDQTLFTELTELPEDYLPVGEREYEFDDKYTHEHEVMTMLDIVNEGEVQDWESEEINNMGVGETFWPEYKDGVTIKRIK